MQGIYLIVFQVFIIIFFGIFVRTPTDDNSLTTYITTISSGFYFLLGTLFPMLAYTATSFKYKMLDWTMLSNMLFILIICLQLNTLYIMFWSSCFDGFTSTSNYSSLHLIVGIQAALCIMITCFEFIGRLNKAQIFVIAMIQVFAFAFNWVIQFKGVKSMTGGAIMTSVLFGYVFSLPIRKLKFNETPQFGEQKQKYFTLTLKFIGLVILIFLWPSFNVMTAIPDFGITNIKSTSLLLQQAYLQTFLCLLSAVVTTLAVRIYGQKILINHFVNSIINTGILIGASASVIIDPFAAVLLGVTGPIIYLLYQKYLSPLLMKNYPFDKILMCFLSAILNAIFVAGRKDRDPALADDYSKQGGLQFANFILSFCFALVFGLIAGFILSKINSLNDETSNKDSLIWMIQQEIIPLYSDDPLIMQIHEKQMDKKFKKQQQIFNLKQSLMTDKNRQNGELGKILKQQIEYQSRIK